MLEYQLEHIFSFSVALDEGESLGFCPDGLRTNVYSKGGEVSGPKVTGRVRPGGGNWAVIRPDGVALIDYRLTLETADGALIYLTFAGSCDFGESAYEKLKQGAGRELGRYREHRVGLQCHTAHPAYRWLNRVHCLGIGRFDTEEVTIRYEFYAVH